MSYNLTSAEQKVMKKFRLQFLSGTECSYCGRRLMYLHIKIDHKLPVSRGGKTVPKNLAPCCEQCNTEKGSKTPEEFALYLDFKDRMDALSLRSLIDSLNYYQEILRETRDGDALDTDGFLVRWKCQAISKLISRRMKK